MKLNTMTAYLHFKLRSKLKINLPTAYFYEKRNLSLILKREVLVSTDN